MDIKPDNIGYSPHFHKYVFIDFGFAEILKENIGEKTLMFPKGTVRFMSEEMSKATRLNRKSYIDLYSNDLYGLKETFKLQVQSFPIIR